jgi:F-type H+-transporting ATPase subunit b
MTPFVLFAAQSGGLVEMAKSTGEQFGFNTSLFISQVISFLIVAVLLHRFAYKPILKVLEERRQTIAQGLANADKIKEELAKTEAARQQIMAQANSQANKLIEEARAAAAKVQEAETQKAIAAAEQIIAKAREAASQDLERERQNLRREIGQLVVRTTAQVTGKVLTMDDQKRLIDETGKQMAA